MAQNKMKIWIIHHENSCMLLPGSMASISNEKNRPRHRQEIEKQSNAGPILIEDRLLLCQIEDRLLLCQIDD